MRDPASAAKRVIITQCLSLAIGLAVIVWGSIAGKTPLIILGFVLVAVAAGMIGVGVWLLRRAREGRV